MDHRAVTESKLRSVRDGVIKGFVDNMEIFSVTDTTFAKGTIALYYHRNWGAFFDEVKVIK